MTTDPETKSPLLTECERLMQAMLDAGIGKSLDGLCEEEAFVCLAIGMSLRAKLGDGQSDMLATCAAYGLLRFMQARQQAAREGQERVVVA